MRILGGPEKYEQDGSLQEGRGGRRMLLVAILIVLALFGYLYFFTNMIRSHEEPQPSAEALVRKPLPRKGGPLGSMSTSVKHPVAGATPATTGEKPAANLKEPGTRNSEPGVQKPPADKAAPKKSPPEQQAKPTAASHPAGGAAVTPPVAPPPVKSSPVTTVPAKPVSPPASTISKPQLQKAAPPVKPVAKPAAKPEPAAAGSEGKYAVQCGPFATTRELIPARDALKKAGLNPVASPGPKKPMLMYRLFVAGYSDAAVAAAESKKLLEATPDAFVLPHDGNYELFAGSYHEEGRATKMQDRLSAKGIKVELRQITAPVPSRRLIAGSFPTREAAGTVAERLKKDGIACIVTQRGH